MHSGTSGKLFIPQGEKSNIVQEEPALPKRFKKDKERPRLFMSIPREIKVGERDPDYQSYLNQITLRRYDDAKSIQLLVQPKREGGFARVAEVKYSIDPGHPKVFKQLPEVTEIIQTAFVDLADIEDYQPAYHYEKIDGFIFPHEKASPADIVQGLLDDCFFLSAVGEILSQEGGFDFIKSIMLQEGDYTTVKLFNPIINDFQYIKVENSNLYLGDKCLVKHRQPWIHILEKAYAVMASKSDGLVPGQRRLFPSFMSIFTGDNPSHAMRILTGKPADFLLIEKKPIIHPFALLMQESKKTDKKEEDENNILLQIFKEQEKVEAWKALLPIHQGLLISLLEECEISNKNRFFSNAHDRVRFQNQTKFFLQKLKQVKTPDNKGELMSKEIIQALRNFYEDGSRYIKETFPGNLGQHQYTETQNNFFNALKNACEQKKLVTAGSLATGEPVGICPDHAYMVLGVRENEGSKWIKLRNPYGFFGRTYKAQGEKLIPQEIHSAEFELELQDFCDLFLGCSIGDFPKVPALNLKLHPRGLSKQIEKIEIAFLQMGIDQGIDQKAEDAKKEVAKIQQFITEMEINFDGLITYAQGLPELSSEIKDGKTNYNELKNNLLVELEEVQRFYYEIKDNKSNLSGNCQDFLKELKQIETQLKAIDPIINAARIEAQKAEADKKNDPIYKFQCSNSRSLKVQGLAASVAISMQVAQQVMNMESKKFATAFLYNAEEGKEASATSPEFTAFIEAGIALEANFPTNPKIFAAFGKKINRNPADILAFIDAKETKTPGQNLKLLSTKIKVNKTDLQDCYRDFSFKGYGQDDLTFLLADNKHQLVFYVREIENKKYYCVYDCSPFSGGTVFIYEDIHSALNALPIQWGKDAAELTMLTTHERYTKKRDFNLIKPFLVKLERKIERDLDKNYQHLCHILYHLRETKLADENKAKLLGAFKATGEEYFDQLTNKITSLKKETMTRNAIKELAEHNSDLILKLTECKDLKEGAALLSRLQGPTDELQKIALQFEPPMLEDKKGVKEINPFPSPVLQAFIEKGELYQIIEDFDGVACTSPINVFIQQIYNRCQRKINETLSAEDIVILKKIIQQTYDNFPKVQEKVIDVLTAREEKSAEDTGITLQASSYGYLNDKNLIGSFPEKTLEEKQVKELRKMCWGEAIGFALRAHYQHPSAIAQRLPPFVDAKEMKEKKLISAHLAQRFTIPLVSKDQKDQKEQKAEQLHVFSLNLSITGLRDFAGKPYVETKEDSEARVSRIKAYLTAVSAQKPDIILLQGIDSYDLKLHETLGPDYGCINQNNTVTIFNSHILKNESQTNTFPDQPLRFVHIQTKNVINCHHVGSLAEEAKDKNLTPDLKPDTFTQPPADIIFAAGYFPASVQLLDHFQACTTSRALGETESRTGLFYSTKDSQAIQVQGELLDPTDPAKKLDPILISPEALYPHYIAGPYSPVILSKNHFCFNSTSIEELQQKIPGKIEMHKNKYNVYQLVIETAYPFLPLASLRKISPQPINGGKYQYTLLPFEIAEHYHFLYEKCHLKNPAKQKILNKLIRQIRSLSKSNDDISKIKLETLNRIYFKIAFFNDFKNHLAYDQLNQEIRTDINDQTINTFNRKPGYIGAMFGQLSFDPITKTKEAIGHVLSYLEENYNKAHAEEEEYRERKYIRK